MPRYFTLTQAERLLPTVELSLRQALACKSRYEEAGQRIQKATQRIVNLGGSIANREQFVDLRRQRDAAEEELRQAINEIHETGCQVKDLDMGLIDFPTRYREREVLLCWKFGENGIRYWHGLEEGFRGRKPIDDDFLEHHSGDA
jgi:hypothetical protein